MADWDALKLEEFRQNKKQLDRSVEKNALLYNQLEEANEEIERAHEQIENQLKIIEELKSKNRRLEEKLSQDKSSQNLDEDSDRLLSNRRFYEDKDRKIDELYITLKNKDRVIETLTSNQIFSQEKLEEMRQELENKNRDMEILQKRLKTTEKSIDTLFLNNKTEGEFVSELQYLKADNKRLLALLGKSHEYKILGDFIESSNGAHYVPSNKPATDETQNWVPLKVTKAIEVYKKAPELSDDVLNTLMLEINKSYREREKGQISKLKHEYQSKIDDLKRQLLMRKPYDNVRTQRQNSRLKSELKKATNEINVISSKQIDVMPKLQDLEETLKIINALKTENAKLQKENNELKKNKAAKSQFLEGIGWLGEKVMKQKSQMHQLIKNLVGNFEFDGEASKEKQEWLMVRYM